MHDTATITTHMATHIQYTPPHTPRRLLNAARLVAPAVDHVDHAAGFDWCAVRLTTAGCGELAQEVELVKASSLLAEGRAKEAIDVYRVREGGGRVCEGGVQHSLMVMMLCVGCANDMMYVPLGCMNDPEGNKTHRETNHIG